MSRKRAVRPASSDMAAARDKAERSRTRATLECLSRTTGLSESSIQRGTFFLLAVVLCVLFFARTTTSPGDGLTVTSATTTRPQQQPPSTHTQPSATPPASAKSGASVNSARPARVAGASPPIVRARVLATLPHDSSAFTQGLLMTDSVVYESTGLYGRSQVRQVDLDSGRVMSAYDIPAREFGEGLCLFEDRLIQLTWQNHIGYVYSLADFTRGPVETFAYATDGWGITHDGVSLIMSDGSSDLFFLSPRTFSVERTLSVRWHRHGRLQPVRMLNELEYIDGVIYANIWLTNYIALIDPTSGLVLKLIDASHLHPDPTNHEMTLNGIAWDDQNERLIITGKLWPHMFHIEFVGVDREEPTEPTSVVETRQN